jgi:hypothetical protein
MPSALRLSLPSGPSLRLRLEKSSWPRADPKGACRRLFAHFLFLRGAMPCYPGIKASRDAARPPAANRPAPASARSQVLFDNRTQPIGPSGLIAARKQGSTWETENSIAPNEPTKRQPRSNRRPAARRPTPAPFCNLQYAIRQSPMPAPSPALCLGRPRRDLQQHLVRNDVWNHKE